MPEFTISYNAQVSMTYKNIISSEAADEFEAEFKKWTPEQIAEDLKRTLVADDVKVTDYKIFRNDDDVKK